MTGLAGEVTQLLHDVVRSLTQRHGRVFVGCRGCKVRLNGLASSWVGTVGWSFDWQLGRESDPGSGGSQCSSSGASEGRQEISGG